MPTAEQLNQMIAEAVKQTDNVSNSIADKGVMVVLSAVVIIVFLVGAILFGLIFVKKVLPDTDKNFDALHEKIDKNFETFNAINNKLSDKIAPSIFQIYEQTLDWKEYMQGQTSALKALEEAIMGAYTIINEKKKLSLDDFKLIAPLRTTKTILKIYTDICDIIDKNNLVENIELIAHQIEIIINNEVEEGRNYLCTLQFEDNILLKFTKGTDTLKEDAKLKIQEAFIDASDALEKLDEGLINIEKYFLKEETLTKQNVIDYANNIDKKRYMKEAEYYKLKKRVWSVFETIQTQSLIHIRNL